MKKKTRTIRDSKKEKCIFLLNETNPTLKNVLRKQLLWGDTKSKIVVSLKVTLSTAENVWTSYVKNKVWQTCIKSLERYSLYLLHLGSILDISFIFYSHYIHSFKITRKGERLLMPKKLGYVLGND